MGCLSKLGQYPSTGPPTYQIIKVPNANHMNVMKTSLTIIPNVSSGAPSSLLEFFQAYPLLHKGLGHLAALYLLYLLVTRYNLSYHKTIYHLQFQCLQKTLLKTAYHFLLLLVGFDTLTYRKDYDRSPILVGHQDSFLAPLPGSVALLVSGTK